MTALPSDLSGLSMLASARQKAADYYAPLLDCDDDIVKVGAWCALLDREEVSVEQYPRVVELATHGAIQRRAFRFFEANWEHDLAAAVAGKIATTPASARALAMRAELACDPQAEVEAQRYRFLATGRFDALVAMVTKDEQAAGWRAALSLAVKVFILNPHDPMAASLVLHLLYDARQPDLLDAAIGLLEDNALHPFVTQAYRAGLALMRGHARDCLKLLDQLDQVRSPRPDVLMRIRPLALALRAEAIETLGDYPKAYRAYVELNRIDSGKAVRLEDFQTVILDAAAREVPELPPDPNRNHVVMTGFPRSGTTLLENALAAHPKIETFEEIPATASMETYLQRALPKVRTAEGAVQTYLKARERYYGEEARRHRKLGAGVFIDKLPMRSAEAAFMSRVFPDKRYIFSIRHPFDVVLSCFKQSFARNIAMEHFRTFDGAVQLYDFTMKQWFGSYSLNDGRVHYLRYDALVLGFEESMRGVLSFLGLEWDESIRKFADLAAQRSTRTPSYQKVRQGLTLGVQSQWRNYGFLFQSDAARPLFRWAEFFGYPTS